LQLGAQLQVTQRTAWFLNHRIREMFLENAPDMLKEIVEADETYMGVKIKIATLIKGKQRTKMIKSPCWPFRTWW